MKILKRLCNNKGFSYVFVCVVFIILMMISALIFEFVRLNTIAANIREKFEDALVSISVSNYNSTYASNRDGFTAAYKYSYSDGKWSDKNNVSQTNINQTVLRSMNYGEKNQVTDVRNIKFEITQTKGAAGSRFNIEGSCTVDIPFIFLWTDTVTMNINADTEWIAKF